MSKINDNLRSSCFVTSKRLLLAGQRQSLHHDGSSNEDDEQNGGVSCVSACLERLKTMPIN